MTAPLALPCAYRTCRAPAVVIVTGTGTGASYSAGSCRQHEVKIRERAHRRTSGTVVVTPVRNPPPAPQNQAAPLF